MKLIKDDMVQYLKDEIFLNEVKRVAVALNLQKGQEAIKKYISTIKDNVNKKI